jgi:nitrate reductase gamma subunit
VTTLLWVILPYVSLAIFVVGHFWRYKYDKFGWTTRSSQLYESKLLRIGSPLFHFGTFFAIMGHVMGLLLPKSWTDAAGIHNDLYHSVAVVGGLAAGIALVSGLVILIYRRRTIGSVFSATTVNDKIMYLVLGLTILLGMWNTLSTTASHEYNYREGVSVWFRQLFTFSPDPALMAAAPIQFQIHTVLAFLLVAMWPFTRLVHVFSAPLGYFTRPYIVYRSKDEREGRGTGIAGPARGWDKPVLKK